MTIKAIYRDEADNIFSGIVVRTADGWRIQTDEHGPRKIEYYFEENSAEGGYIQFVDYEISPEQPLRAADVIPYINSVRATLPFPQRPTDSPQVRSESQDERIRVDADPQGNSLRALQQAGTRAALAAATQRVQEQRKMIETLNQPNALREQQARVARQARNEVAAAMKKKMEQ